MARNSILTVVEHRMGKLREVSYEAISFASSIAKQKNLKLTSVLLGENLNEIATEVAFFVDKFFYLDGKELKYYTNERYILALDELIKELDPLLIIMPHSIVGMDLAPRLATHLNASYIPDCLDISILDDGLKATREIFGGKIIAQYVTADTGRYVATIRPGIYAISEEKNKNKEIIKKEISFNDVTFNTEFLELIEPTEADIDISKADIVIGVGRGIGDKENLPIVEELAELLGGVLAATRPVVDNGWLPKSRQVGQSGKTVKPKLYLALGLSGSSQHVLGMKNSHHIVAINNDPQAPIFNIADEAILGDVLEVVPALINKIKASSHG